MIIESTTTNHRIDSMNNYRNELERIARLHARPGEDFESVMLAGAPRKITAAEALAFALWVESEADAAWGKDLRHQRIAEDIRQAIREGEKNARFMPRADDLTAKEEQLLAVAKAALHQISTDSDLETITGAAKYESLEAELRRVIALAEGGDE